LSSFGAHPAKVYEFAFFEGSGESIYGSATFGGEGIPLVDIVAKNDSDPNDVYSTTTELDGAFLLFVPEATYTVTASKDFYNDDVESPIEVGEGASVEVNFTLEALSGITGVVRNSLFTDTLVEGALIEAVNVSDSNDNYSTFSKSGDLAGRFSLATPPGTYDLNVTAVGYEDNTSLTGIIVIDDDWKEDVDPMLDPSERMEGP